MDKKDIVVAINQICREVGSLKGLLDILGIETKVSVERISKYYDIVDNGDYGFRLVLKETADKEEAEKRLMFATAHIIESLVRAGLITV